MPPYKNFFKLILPLNQYVVTQIVIELVYDLGDLSTSIALNESNFIGLSNINPREIYFSKELSVEYLGGEATAFPLSLAFEDEGFGFKGSEIGDATGEVGWADGFASVVSAPAIATTEDLFDLAEEPKGDFGHVELGLLGRVSGEEKFDASLVDL